MLTQKCAQCVMILRLALITSCLDAISTRGIFNCFRKLFTSYTDVFTTISSLKYIKFVLILLSLSFRIVSNKFIYGFCLPHYFLPLRELFIDDYLTRTNSAQLNLVIVRLHSQYTLIGAKVSDSPQAPFTEAIDPLQVALKIYFISEPLIKCLSSVHCIHSDAVSDLEHTYWNKK